MDSYPWLLILNEIKGSCAYINSCGIYISSVRSLFARLKHLALLICVHICHLDRLFVALHTKIQCWSQSHLSYAWLEGVRKFSDLWGSSQVRCWNNTESYSQDWEGLRTIWFFQLMELFIFKPYSLLSMWSKTQYKRSREIILLACFPASLYLFIMCFYLPSCVTCWGSQEG